MLLERLNLSFTTLSPDVDETPGDGEPPPDLAVRLAQMKAEAGAAMVPGAIIIGSDQVAECDGQPLGKPGTAERAVEQLLRLQNRKIHFHTAVCVTDGDQSASENVKTVVQMRPLSREQIRRYVELENPVDCAGAFKSEAMGIALMDAMRSDDPTALIGLPLIATRHLLERFGLAIL
jgi:septum formation protein